MTQSNKLGGLALALLCAASAAGQPASSRGMHSQVFGRLRPPKAEAKPTPAKTPAAKSRPAPAPAPAKAAAADPDPAGLGNTFIGLNLWRMRLADQPSAVSVRGLRHRTQDPQGVREWVPAHATLEDAFAEGENLRLSIESARDGYLYVIDRDVYADGTNSPPTLIFPTYRLRQGNNHVQPGVPVEIPDYRDRPPAFSVERTRAGQTAIEVTMIVTPQPLAEIRIQQEEQELPATFFTQLQRRWGTDVEKTEDDSLAGSLYTVAEMNAAQSSEQPLGPNDPLPQTLYHRAGHPGEPMLVTAVIRLKPE